MSAHAAARLILEEPLTSSQIGARLGARQPTVYEWLRGLAAEGYAVREGKGGPWSLTEAGVRYALAGGPVLSARTMYGRRDPPKRTREIREAAIAYLAGRPASPTIRIARAIDAPAWRVAAALDGAVRARRVTRERGAGVDLWTVRRAA